MDDMLSPTPSHPAGVIPANVRAKPLGKCPKCVKQFTKSLYAFKCSICERNFHAMCINKAAPTDEVATLSLKKMNGNYICEDCVTVSRQHADDLMVLDQKMQTTMANLRAREVQVDTLTLSAKKAEEEAQAKIAQLQSMAENTQSTAANAKFQEDFEMMKNEHDRNRDLMANMKTTFEKEAVSLKNRLQNAETARQVLLAESTAQLNELRAKTTEQQNVIVNLETNSAKRPRIESGSISQESIFESASFRAEFNELKNAISAQYGNHEHMMFDVHSNEFNKTNS